MRPFVTTGERSPLQGPLLGKGLRSPLGCRYITPTTRRQSRVSQAGRSTRIGVKLWMQHPDNQGVPPRGMLPVKALDLQPDATAVAIGTIALSPSLIPAPQRGGRGTDFSRHLHATGSGVAPTNLRR